MLRTPPKEKGKGKMTSQEDNSPSISDEESSQSSEESQVLTTKKTDPDTQSETEKSKTGPDAQWENEKLQIMTRASVSKMTDKLDPGPKKAEVVAAADRSAKIREHLQVLEKEIGSKKSPRAKSMANLILELARDRNDRGTKTQIDNMTKVAELIEGLQGELENSMGNVSKRLKTLETEKEVLRAENELLRKSHDEILAVNNKTKEEIMQANLDLTALTASKEEMAKMAKEIDDMLIKVRPMNEQTSSQAEIDRVLKEVEEVKRKIKDSEEGTSVLSSEIKEMMDKFQPLEREISSMKTCLGSSNDENKLKSVIEPLEGQIQDIKQAFVEPMERKLEELREALAKRQEQDATTQENGNSGVKNELLDVLNEQLRQLKADLGVDKIKDPNEDPTSIFSGETVLERLERQCNDKIEDIKDNIEQLVEVKVDFAIGDRTRPSSALGTNEEGSEEKLQQLGEIRTKMEELQKEIMTTQKTVNRVKLDKIKKDIEMAKKGILTRGLSMHPDAVGYETNNQTQEVVWNFAEFLGVANKIRIISVQRFTARREDSRPPFIKIELESAEHAKLLMDSFYYVAKRDQRLRGISIAELIPKCLKSENKSLEEQASILRQFSLKTKPRVIIEGTELALAFKIGNENKFFRHSQLEKLKSCVSELVEGQNVQSTATQQENDQVSSQPKDNIQIAADRASSENIPNEKEHESTVNSGGVLNNPENKGNEQGQKNAATQHASNASNAESRAIPNRGAVSAGGRGARAERGHRGGRGNRGRAPGLGFLVRPRGSFNPGFGGERRERGGEREDNDEGRSYTQNPSYQRNVDLDERSRFEHPAETGTRQRTQPNRQDQNWPEPRHAYQRREPYMRHSGGRGRNDPSFHN